MLLWVLPVVAIGIGGWVIYARSRRRVRVVPEAFPEQSVPEGKRAGYVAYLPGIVVGVNCGWRQLLPDRKLSTGENLAAGHGTGSGVAGQGAGSEADPLNEEEMSRLALGMRTQLQKNPGDIEGWIMLGRVGMALGNASIATDAYATAYRLDPKKQRCRTGLC
ncbi:cytochrome C-type biogenesis protein [Escherichia coli]|uniref:Cytochrome C-type biogenesis protein n=1 Tax=Escherichia coli TaxID=562 RepID=A0A376TEL6_ECOLX|nr:cytochrome C-type biogenesis protein [Escherichia coli]